MAAARAPPPSGGITLKWHYQSALLLAAAVAASALAAAWSAGAYAKTPSPTQQSATAAQQTSPAAQPPSRVSQPPTTTAAGTYSAAGLYNLANAYARAGKPGMAVLNYERADLLAPNDIDVQANLTHVRQALHLPVQAQGPLDRIAHLASPETVAWLGVVGILITGASLIAIKILPRYRALWIATACASLAPIGFTACNAIYWEPKTHDAVVIAASTTIRATPVPMGDSLQELPEAQTVTVLQGHEDFVLIRTPSGRSGWVARADLADVVPATSVR